MKQLAAFAKAPKPVPLRHRSPSLLRPPNPMTVIGNMMAFVESTAKMRGLDVNLTPRPPLQ